MRWRGMEGGHAFSTRDRGREEGYGMLPLELLDIWVGLGRGGKGVRGHCWGCGPSGAREDAHRLFFLLGVYLFMDTCSHCTPPPSPGGS